MKLVYHEGLKSKIHVWELGPKSTEASHGVSAQDEAAEKSAQQDGKACKGIRNFGISKTSSDTHAHGNSASIGQNQDNNSMIIII